MPGSVSITSFCLSRDENPGLENDGFADVSDKCKKSTATKKTYIVGDAAVQRGCNLE